MPDPVIVLAFAVGYAKLREWGTASGDSEPPTDLPPERFPDPEQPLDPDELSGWHFPVPDWGDYRATRSDYFQAVKTSNHRQHLGVDICYQRSRVPNAQDAQFKSGTPNGTPGFFMPDGVPVLNPRAGRVWSTGYSVEFGPWCIIDCGKPFAVYMVHFDQLLIAGAPRGTPIELGAMIGTIGGPPQGYNFKHLHLEIWKNGGREGAVDPWPYLKGAKRP